MNEEVSKKDVKEVTDFIKKLFVPTIANAYSETARALLLNVDNWTIKQKQEFINLYSRWVPMDIIEEAFTEFPYFEAKRTIHLTAVQTGDFARDTLIGVIESAINIK